MKKIMAVMIIAIFTAILIPSLSAQPEVKIIIWSDIYDTEMKKNNNFWKAEADFNITIENVDAFAFKFITNETPPSNHAKIWLFDNNGTAIIQKERVNLTEDVINGTWHIEYLNTTVNVTKGHNYTFRFWIKKNYDMMQILDGSFASIGDFNFKFGYGQLPAIVPVPEPAPHSRIVYPPATTDEYYIPPAQINDTEGSGFFDNCGTAYIFPVVIGLGGMVEMRRRKYGAKPE